MVLWRDKIIQLQDTWVHFSVLAGVYGGGASGSNGVAATSIVGFCGKLLHRLRDYFDQLGFGAVNHSGLLQSCSIYSLVRLNKQRGFWGTCSSVKFCSCAVQLWRGGIWWGSVRRFGLRCACPHVKFLDHASLPCVRDGGKHEIGEDSSKPVACSQPVCEFSFINQNSSSQTLGADKNLAGHHVQKRRG